MSNQAWNQEEQHQASIAELDFLTKRVTELEGQIKALRSHLQNIETKIYVSGEKTKEKAND